MAERRIILLGKTGNGKSFTGNSILRQAAFKHAKSLVAVTTSLNTQTGFSSYNSCRYLVCDTPGLLDADAKLVERVLQVQESVQLCPEPHAFLLVFSSLSRMTEDEKRTIDILRIMFGELVFDHCIVVFTRGDEFEDDAEFDEFVKRSHELGKLIAACGNRVVRIENRKRFVDSRNRSDIERLLELIEEVSSGGHKAYTYKWLANHTDVLKRHVQPNDGKDDIDAQLQDISTNLARVLKREDWKVRLQYAAGGAVAALGGVVALGIGALRLLS